MKLRHAQRHGVRPRRNSIDDICARLRMPCRQNRLPPVAARFATVPLFASSLFSTERHTEHETRATQLRIVSDYFFFRFSRTHYN